jgi:mRNA interferase RelE/StbE
MSQFEVYITPQAWREVKEAPGHIRQRLRRAIDALATAPRPAESRALSLSQPQTELSELPVYELRRIRIDQWRIVYAITEADRLIDILTIRKRPPYDYGDLSELLSEIG